MPISTEPSPDARPTEAGTPTVDIVVPVHDEAKVLEAKIARLHDYLVAHFPLSWRITIADSGSDDDTGALAAELAAGRPLPDALVFANAAAALCVQRMGAGPSMPVRAEVAAIRLTV